MANPHKNQKIVHFWEEIDSGQYGSSYNSYNQNGNPPGPMVLRMRRFVLTDYGRIYELIYDPNYSRWDYKELSNNQGLPTIYQP